MQESLTPKASQFLTMPFEEEREYYAHNNRLYAAFAHFYDFVVLPFRPLRRKVAALVEAHAKSRVLDVATGTGAQAREFARTAEEVVGVDLSDAMLRVARKKNRTSNLRFQRADSTELPFDDSTFDIACISFALHEMPASIRTRTIAEMARVTRAGGIVIIIDHGRPGGPFGPLLFRILKLFERKYYPEFVNSDLRPLLEAAALRVTIECQLLQGAARVLIATRTGR
jgi:ubiquinone/menaquinone biosynthesis C-methylase UbiE